jgi:hypothetical protein
MYYVIHGYISERTNEEIVIHTFAGDRVRIPPASLVQSMPIDVAGGEASPHRFYIAKNATVSIDIPVTSLPGPNDTWVKDYWTDFKYSDDGGTPPKSYDDPLLSRL